MRKTTTIFLLLALLLLAAPATMAKSTITVHPIGLWSLVAGVEFETEIDRFAGDKTFVVQVASWDPGPIPASRTVRATGFAAGMRYYMDGRAHQGIYVGGNGGLISVSGVRHGELMGARILSLGGVAGYKWSFDSGFVVDAGAGMTLPLSTNVLTSNITEGDLVGITGMNIYAGVGYTF